MKSGQVIPLLKKNENISKDWQEGREERQDIYKQTSGKNKKD